MITKKELQNNKVNDEFIQYLINEKTKSKPFSNIDYDNLVRKILPYIGDPNPVVRDETVYECLAYVSTKLSNDQKRDLITRYITTDFLFFDLENKSKNSVLTRTFTLLQLATLLHDHNQTSYIDKNLIKKIVDSLTQYLQQESILKGYDEVVGWIHAIAHSADVLGQLLMSNDVSESMHQELLKVFTKKVQVNHYIYVDGEDERIARALVKGLLSKQLSEEHVKRFVYDLADYDKQVDYIHFSKIYNNVKSLLRSLYFALEEEKHSDLQLLIIEALKDAKTDKIL